MKAFDTILVGNRGEIAVRILKTARALGYRTVAVHSEADKDALHVAMADEAVHIGAAPSRESYLNIEKIVAAAKRSGAQAVHPGYGFLSENARFAEACEREGIVFIGPPSEAIAVMGNKAESKRRMIDAGVPCIPGYQGLDQSDDTLIKAAKKIGFPIMVKAAAGGGGRGMRLVHAAKELPMALRSARSEAENAFGSGELILERALIEPRHVEIQVFGDKHGAILHFGERDCSVQRRHQKVVEESPCPVMTPELRRAMGAAAVAAAKSVNYVGAGTVEFLLDSDSNFYFLEMNTRLQVEHPVTEMVTGTDLVALQISVAQGNPLGMNQDDVHLRGHAIEVRLYAEDTAGGFLPATGRALVWRTPAIDGVRIDNGLLEGQEVSPFYDPMLAKVIAWGENRDVARRRLVRALEEIQLFGLENNREFLIDVLTQDEFARGEATTSFIGKYFDADRLKKKAATEEHYRLAAVLKYREASGYFDARKVFAPPAGLSGWSSSQEAGTSFAFAATARTKVKDAAPVGVTRRAVQGREVYEVRQSAGPVTLEVISVANNAIRFSTDGHQKTARYCFPDSVSVTVQIGAQTQTFVNVLEVSAGIHEAHDDGNIRAPMHGAVVDVMVEVDADVEEGQVVAVMEAMKMQHQLIASRAGRVAAVNVKVGTQVASGMVMIEIG